MKDPLNTVNAFKVAYRFMGWGGVLILSLVFGGLIVSLSLIVLIALGIIP